MNDNDSETLSAHLRNGAKGDTICTAAVELLIWHGFWLRRSDFTRAAVDHYPADQMAAIRWDQARQFTDSGPRGLTSEVALLDLAVAIGENRYRLSGFGLARKRAVAEAFAAACGERLEPPIPEVGHSHPSIIPGDPATCHRCALEANDD